MQLNRKWSCKFVHILSTKFSIFVHAFQRKIVYDNTSADEICTVRKTLPSETEVPLFFCFNHSYIFSYFSFLLKTPRTKPRCFYLPLAIVTIQTQFFHELFKFSFKFRHHFLEKIVYDSIRQTNEASPPQASCPAGI